MLTFRHIALAVVLSCAASIQAAPITFFAEDLNGTFGRIAFPLSSAARANFMAQLPGSATETFEEFSNGDLLPLTLAFSGGATATLNGDAGGIQTIASGTNFGRFPTSGKNYVETNASALSFTFAAPVSSFGFYATDVGDFGGQLSLVLTRIGGGTTTVLVPNSLGTGTGSAQSGSVLFFGYIDTANQFSKIQLLDSTAIDSFGLDDVTVGTRAMTGVPEPGSALLTIASLLGLYGIRKRCAV